MTSDARRAGEHDCAQVVTRFFTRLDAVDYEGAWALMGPGGVWKRSGKLLDSRERFLDAMSQRPTALVIRHLVGNLVVDFVDNKHAIADFCLTVFRFIGDAGDRPAPISLPSAVAAFRAEMTHTDDAWRIVDLSGKTLFA